MLYPDYALTDKIKPVFSRPTRTARPEPPGPTGWTARVWVLINSLDFEIKYGTLNFIQSFLEIFQFLNSFDILDFDKDFTVPS